MVVQTDATTVPWTWPNTGAGDPVDAENLLFFVDGKAPPDDLLKFGLEAPSGSDCVLGQRGHRQPSHDGALLGRRVQEREDGLSSDR